MLSRSQVAKRLRRSVSTVRRLERHELFPVCDARGIYWFDEREVEAVRKRIERGQATSARGAWLSRPVRYRKGLVAREVISRDRNGVARENASEEVEVKRLRRENKSLRARLHLFTVGTEALLKLGLSKDVLEILERARNESEV